ncbi:MAG: TatA/E family twin arginine-targeting protein translocase [Synechococcales bacterium]|nr:TatA/E family twin arginine-targeting protein translocase [Synechococcales bacterium]
MNVFGIGLPEMALIFIVALLIFGPKKLPEIGRSLGKAIRGFQDASKEFENEFKREAEQIEKSVKEPMKATLEKPETKALSSAKTSTKSDAESAEEIDEAEVMETSPDSPNGSGEAIATHTDASAEKEEAVS